MNSFSRIVIVLSLIIIGSSANASIDFKTMVKEAVAGKTFADVLTSLGFTKKDANRLLADRVVPPKMHLVPGEKYLVLVEPSKKRTEARFYIDYSNDALVFWHDAEQAGLERRPIDFGIVKKTVAGKIRGSLIESIKHLISDEWAAFRFSDAFAWDFNVGRDLASDDSYKFVIEEKFDHGKFVRYGEILDAELHTHGTTLKRVLWVNDSTRVFVDPNDHFEQRPFYSPVDYVHISSPFTKRRFHPVKHNYQPHLGVDFALNEGSPVYAPKEGTVIEVAHHRANGNYVQIRHAGDFITTYNHLDRPAAGLAPGKHVGPGEIIGYVGCTGYCTSPHLDFRIRHGDYLYDPIFLTKPYPYKERNYWESNKFKELIGYLTTRN